MPRRCACGAPSSTATARVSKRLLFYGAACTPTASTSRSRMRPPIEETGGPQVKDISGLHPARHREVGGFWAASMACRRPFWVSPGKSVVALDGSDDPSFRRAFGLAYMMVDGYGLLNARVGFRWSGRMGSLLYGRATCWTRTLLRVPHRSARWIRSDRGAAWRSPNRWRDPAEWPSDRPNRRSTSLHQSFAIGANPRQRRSRMQFLLILILASVDNR